MLVPLAFGLIFIALSHASRAADPANGKAVFGEHCVSCHGLHGTGNGPLGQSRNPKPTDLATATPNDDEWSKAIKLGTKAIGKSDGMKPLGDALSDQDVLDVIAYVKTLKAK